MYKEKAVIGVLVADDQRIVRAGVRELLSVSTMPVRCMVAEAANTDQVLAMTGTNVYDVILMDYVFPSLNGPRVTELVLARNPSACILALSTYEERAYVEHMVQAGARGYVLKNTEPDTLLTAMQTAMNGRRYYSNEIAQQWMDAGMAPKTVTVLDRLTAREKEVFRQVVKGCRSREIAAQMFVDKRTVDKHRQHVMTKLGVHSAAELVRLGVTLGL
jgi:DNA-binding NarL/FixJ family response regulator